MGFHDRFGRARPSEPGDSDDLPVIELDTEDAPPPARPPLGPRRRRVVVALIALALAAGAIVAVAARHDGRHARTAETVVLPQPGSPTTQPLGTLDPNAEFVSTMGVLSPRAAWSLNTLDLSLTTDGGVSWRNITPPGFLDPVDHTNALEFLDARHAWLATDAPSGTIWRTADGGRSWKPMPFDHCAGACGPVISIHFLDARRGWISYVQGGAGGLAATDDGGATWNVLPQPPVLGPIHFDDARHGWLTGEEQPGAIFRTADGGARWSFVGPADASATTISAPVFFGPDTIVAAAINEYRSPQRMTVTRSNDGGGSWTTTPIPVEGDVAAHDPTEDRFTATSPSDWILLDGERLYLTKDAGAHWTTLRPTRTRLRKVAFTSRTEGWLLADIPDCGDQITECSDQYLYGTVDGGRTWTLRSPTAGITANRSP